MRTNQNCKKIKKHDFTSERHRVIGVNGLRDEFDGQVFVAEVQVRAAANVVLEQTNFGGKTN